MVDHDEPDDEPDPIYTQVRKPKRKIVKVRPAIKRNFTYCDAGNVDFANLPM